MSIIEKLEALCKLLSSISRTDTKEMADLCAIIEEYKNSQQPIGYMSQPSLTNLINGNDVIVGKKSELRDVSIFAHPPLSDETVKDAGKYIFSIDKECINEIVANGMVTTIDRAKHAHWTNVNLRINGKDEETQADWIKYLVLEKS